MIGKILQMRQRWLQKSNKYYWIHEVLAIATIGVIYVLMGCISFNSCSLFAIDNYIFLMTNNCLVAYSSRKKFKHNTGHWISFYITLYVIKTVPYLALNLIQLAHKYVFKTIIHTIIYVVLHFALVSIYNLFYANANYIYLDVKTQCVPVSANRLLQVFILPQIKTLIQIFSYNKQIRNIIEGTFSIIVFLMSPYYPLCTQYYSNLVMQYVINAFVISGPMFNNLVSLTVPFINIVLFHLHQCYNQQKFLIQQQFYNLLMYGYVGEIYCRHTHQLIRQVLGDSGKSGKVTLKIYKQPFNEVDISINRQIIYNNKICSISEFFLLLMNLLCKPISKFCYFKKNEIKLKYGYILHKNLQNDWKMQSTVHNYDIFYQKWKDGNLTVFDAGLLKLYINYQIKIQGYVMQAVFGMLMDQLKTNKTTAQQEQLLYQIVDYCKKDDFFMIDKLSSKNVILLYKFLFKYKVGQIESQVINWLILCNYNKDVLDSKQINDFIKFYSEKTKSLWIEFIYLQLHEDNNITSYRQFLKQRLGGYITSIQPQFQLIDGFQSSRKITQLLIPHLSTDMRQQQKKLQIIHTQNPVNQNKTQYIYETQKFQEQEKHHQIILEQRNKYIGMQLLSYKLQDKELKQNVKNLEELFQCEDKCYKDIDEENELFETENPILLIQRFLTINQNQNYEKELKINDNFEFDEHINQTNEPQQMLQTVSMNIHNFEIYKFTQLLDLMNCLMIQSDTLKQNNYNLQQIYLTSYKNFANYVIGFWNMWYYISVKDFNVQNLFLGLQCINDSFNENDKQLKQLINQYDSYELLCANFAMHEVFRFDKRRYRHLKNLIHNVKKAKKEYYNRFINKNIVARSSRQLSIVSMQDSDFLHLSQQYSDEISENNLAWEFEDGTQEQLGYFQKTIFKLKQYSIIQSFNKIKFNSNKKLAYEMFMALLLFGVWIGAAVTTFQLSHINKYINNISYYAHLFKDTILQHSRYINYYSAASKYDFKLQFSDHIVKFNNQSDQHLNLATLLLYDKAQMFRTNNSAFFQNNYNHAQNAFESIQKLQHDLIQLTNSSYNDVHNDIGGRESQAIQDITTQIQLCYNTIKQMAQIYIYNLYDSVKQNMMFVSIIFLIIYSVVQNWNCIIGFVQCFKIINIFQQITSKDLYYINYYFSKVLTKQIIIGKKKPQSLSEPQSASVSISDNDSANHIRMLNEQFQFINTGKNKKIELKQSNYTMKNDDIQISILMAFPFILLLIQILIKQYIDYESQILNQYHEKINMNVENQGKQQHFFLMLNSYISNYIEYADIDFFGEDKYFSEFLKSDLDRMAQIYLTNSNTMNQGIQLQEPFLLQLLKYIQQVTINNGHLNINNYIFVNDIGAKQLSNLVQLKQAIAHINTFIKQSLHNQWYFQNDTFYFQEYYNNITFSLIKEQNKVLYQKCINYPNDYIKAQCIYVSDQFISNLDILHNYTSNTVSKLLNEQNMEQNMQFIQIVIGISYGTTIISIIIVAFILKYIKQVIIDTNEKKARISVLIAIIILLLFVVFSHLTNMYFSVLQKQMHDRISSQTKQLRQIAEKYNNIIPAYQLFQNKVFGKNANFSYFQVLINNYSDSFNYNNTITDEFLSMQPMASNRFNNVKQLLQSINKIEQQQSIDIKDIQSFLNQSNMQYDQQIMFFQQQQIQNYKKLNNEFTRALTVTQVCFIHFIEIFCIHYIVSYIIHYKYWDSKITKKNTKFICKQQLQQQIYLMGQNKLDKDDNKIQQEVSNDTQYMDQKIPYKIINLLPIFVLCVFCSITCFVNNNNLQNAHHIQFSSNEQLSILNLGYQDAFQKLNKLSTQYNLTKDSTQYIAQYHQYKQIAKTIHYQLQLQTHQKIDCNMQHSDLDAGINNNILYNSGTQSISYIQQQFGILPINEQWHNSFYNLDSEIIGIQKYTLYNKYYTIKNTVLYNSSLNKKFNANRIGYYFYQLYRNLDSCVYDKNDCGKMNQVHEFIFESVNTLLENQQKQQYNEHGIVLWVGFVLILISFLLYQLNDLSRVSYRLLRLLTRMISMVNKKLQYQEQFQ